MKTKTVHVCAVLLAAGILAFVKPLHAAYEAVSQVVTNYCEYTGEPPLFWESHNSCFIGGSCIYDLPVGDEILRLF